MNRKLLRAILALGLVITAMSGMGVFASFNDTANGGDDSIVSGTRPSVADLRIRTGVLMPEGPNGLIDCGDPTLQLPFDQDNLTTGQFTVSDAQPGQDWVSYVCLKNVGASALTLSVAAADIASLETGCTGDEAQVDQTCGLDAAQTPQQGELAGLLSVDIAQVDCMNPASIVYQGAQDVLIQFSPALSDAATSLAPGAVTCVRLKIRYPVVSESDAQLAQSDSATWHFVFTGTAS